MAEKLRADSTAYVGVPLTRKPAVDLTDDTFELGFTAHHNGIPAQWYPAIWDGTLIKVLVGPDGGALELAPGGWYVVARITDTAETPVMEAPCKLLVAEVTA